MGGGGWGMGDGGGGGDSSKKMSFCCTEWGSPGILSVLALPGWELGGTRVLRGVRTAGDSFHT